MFGCRSFACILATLALLGWSSAANASIVHVFDPASGRLIGARNIPVDGELLDVAFLTGSCAQVFSGCDEWSDFVFSNSPFSVDVTYHAAIALQDLVFVDNALGAFDSNIDLTLGCSSTVSQHCGFFVPIGFLSDGSPWVIATSNTNNIDDNVLPSFGGLPHGHPAVFAPDQNSVWVRFSQSAPVSEVPLPAAAPLFIAGLTCFGWSRRRRKMRRPN